MWGYNSKHYPQGEQWHFWQFLPAGILLWIFWKIHYCSKINVTSIATVTEPQTPAWAGDWLLSSGILAPGTTSYLMIAVLKEAAL